MDYRALEQGMMESLLLRKRPVAVKFQDVPPAGIDKFVGTEN